MAKNLDNVHGNIVYQVAVPSPLRKVFDYLSKRDGQFIQPGSRVLVPFRNQTIVGFIVSSSNNSSIASEKLKFIDKILDDEPTLSEEVLSILKWSARYYQHPIGQVLAAAVPKKIREPNPLTTPIKVWRTSEMTSEKKWSLVKNASKQKALLNFLQKKDLSKKDIQKAGFSDGVIKGLEKKGLIFQATKSLTTARPFAPIVENNPRSLILNKEQESALISINKVQNKFQCFVLNGVTGSGKTEVYMQAMQKHLSQGRQCLVLVPEIGLTPQTLNRFSKRFECPICTLHSGLSASERLNAWNIARKGQAGILIGTRSAIFTPFRNLGIIIVDEEHDNSFKQQDGFRYSARDLAILRAKEKTIPVLLGSATPSLETLQNVCAKKYKQLPLTKPAGNAGASTKIVIDTSKQKLIGGLSQQLLSKIEQHLDARKQVLIFINRRGFAPTLSCQNCGWVAECINCSAQKTVHINPPSIRCHHCGHASKVPQNCPSCGVSQFETLGVGTQQLEAILRDRFKLTPVYRIDRDTTRNKNQFEEIIDKITPGESCLMIGTQMIAKGHHFPNITLVAILNADTGLFSPDFRGQEHMAQTLTQVSGRAGRATETGEVVIQSRHASHTTLQNLINRSYSEFAESMLAERKTSGMPPYSRLALLKANAKSLNTAINFLAKGDVLVRDINRKYAEKVISIGPIPAPLEKKGGNFRAHLILKGEKKATLQRLLSELVLKLDEIKASRQLTWGLDVDPVDLT